jgi:N-acetylmuramoyl-L-alanine amidase
MPRFLDRPSPNHDARPADQTVDILLLHYTDMESAEAALARLCDPGARVSAHYCVDEDGTVYRLVGEDRRAWHAGAASWAGASDINARSIGIELVNPGHSCGYRPYPEAQMAALIGLAKAVLARHPIPPARVLGHSDVAPARKQDPGELFDWRALAAAGIGLWPREVKSAAEPPEPLPDIAEIQARLARFGYEVPRHGRLDGDTRAVITAFQRHFRPSAVTGEADGETVARLQALLTAIP